MIIFVIVLFVLSLVIMGGGVAFYVMRRAKATSPPAPPRPAPPVAPPPKPIATTQAPQASAPPFRWRYVLWPLVVLAISVAATAFFYHLLPEPAAWRFAADGSGERFLSRGTLVAILLVPQFVLAGGAAIIALVVSRIGLWMKAGPTPASAGGLIILMSNMVALPQIILCFAMLDIFVYNAYQVHLLKLWVFAVLVMVVGSVVLGICFARAMRQARPTTK
jgi:uncharacterized membrane protein